jgi:hypothetical protein
VNIKIKIKEAQESSSSKTKMNANTHAIFSKKIGRASIYHRKWMLKMHKLKLLNIAVR